MEKYFIVSPKADLYKDYFKYIENRKAVHEHVKRFFDKHEIKAQYYDCLGNWLYIKPTEEDLKVFGSMLCQAELNGLRCFKENSKIGRAWAKSLQETNLKVLSKPQILLYLDHYIPRCRYRLFRVGTVLYGSIETDSEFTLPEGFEEIKASEFYQKLEEIEAKK
jgi:hypothetical protein